MKNDITWTKQELYENSVKEEEFNKLKKIELLKEEDRRRKRELREIRNRHSFLGSRAKKLTTTKLLMYFIFINCIIVELFSMYAMISLADLSALYALIGAVVTESISYAIYCVKSFNDTKEEVASKLERDKFEVKLTDDERTILANLNEDPILDDDHSGDIPKGAQIYEESSDMKR